MNVETLHATSLQRFGDIINKHVEQEIGVCRAAGCLRVELC